MEKISDVFCCLSGNNVLTEEFIYQHTCYREDKMYTVLSSSTDEEETMGIIPLCKNQKGEYIKVFEDHIGILVARNGKAGTMRYLSKGRYTINDHAYILYLKETIKEKYEILKTEEETFLKYFIAIYASQVKNYSTKNDNATWNKTSFFKNFKINKSDFSLHTLQRFKHICQAKEDFSFRFNSIYHQVEFINSKIIALKQSTKTNTSILKKVFDYCSRNDSLSEEGIYYRQLAGNDLTVLSGSSNNLVYGKISKNSEGIHLVENKQCLHLVSRGNAGQLTYLPKGDYATNTNAFLLYLNNEYKKAHNIDTEDKEETILRYYLYFLQPIFYEISSKSDLGVFPLTNAMKTLQIPIIDYSDEIKSVVTTIKSFEQIRKHIFSLKNKYEILINKQLIIND